MDPRRLLAHCRKDLPALLSCLRKAVEIESPSNSKTDIDQMARFFKREFVRYRGKVTLLEHPASGASLMAEFWGHSVASNRKRADRSPEKPLLLLGHIDTVWPKGTLAHMPFRVERGCVYGPGILDMKSGVVLGLAAIRALQTLGMEPASPVRFLLNPDEEVGSHAFRRKIEAEACGARAVLVLEPAAEGGALKTARKGVGEFRITVHGRSAHAGNSPEAGINAIAELCRQILRIERFAERQRGVTLNVGVIEGGTRPNVVPALARAVVDVRIPRLRDRERIERMISGLKPLRRGARLQVEGEFSRPPMERGQTAGLFAKASGLARQLGFEVEEASVGGGSDGNLSAALGIPTLDGLGGVGKGAHSPGEHVVIRELPRRAALLAALLATL